jgi:hypothetical protein
MPQAFGPAHQLFLAAGPAGVPKRVARGPALALEFHERKFCEFESPFEVPALAFIVHG